MHAKPVIVVPSQRRAMKKSDLHVSRCCFIFGMALIDFLAFTVFIITELTHPLRHIMELLHSNGLSYQQQEKIHSISLWTLGIIVPMTNIIFLRLWNETLKSRLQSFKYAKGSTLSYHLELLRHLCHNCPTFVIYQGVSAALYSIFLSSCFTCRMHIDWSFMNDSAIAVYRMCSTGNRAPLAVSAYLTEMLLLSSIISLYSLESQPKCASKKHDALIPISTQRRMVLVLNNYINVLLLVGALLLAFGSDYADYILQLLWKEHDDYRSYSSSDNTLVISPRMLHTTSVFENAIGFVALCVTALFNTYGLGGSLRNKNGWKFYQPLAGGAKFIFFQLISWTCFCLGLLVQGFYLASILILEIERAFGATVLVAVLFTIAEILMIISVFVFKGSSIVQGEDSKSTKRIQCTVQKKLEVLAEESYGALVVSSFLNLPVVPLMLYYAWFAITTNLSGVQLISYAASVFFYQILASPFLAGPRDVLVKQRNWVLESMRLMLKRTIFIIMRCLPITIAYYHHHHGLEATVSVYVMVAVNFAYEWTYRGNPAQSGCRICPSWTSKTDKVMDIFSRYFKVSIISDATLDSEKQYIFAMHPHGIMATSAFWLQYSPAWQTLFPNIRARLLTATVLHRLALVRDVLQWYGAREVTKQAFQDTLDQKENVFIVPGGQAEMLYQDSTGKDIYIYTRHRGFIRLAIQNGVALIPILSFQESQILSNIKVSRVQKWFVKKFAVSFPFLPYGRAFLPIPRNPPTYFAIGQPIQVLQCKNPSEAEIQRVHTEFFQSLQVLFEKHKKEANCEDCKLVFI